MTDPVFTGKCLCGAVKAEIVAEPKWVSHCHCPSCQKATAAAFATYAGFEATAVCFTEELPKVFKSTPGVKRSFCARCGTPISFEGEAWPHEIHLHAGFLNEADKLNPEAHCYVRAKREWVDLNDHLPTFDKFTRDDD